MRISEDEEIEECSYDFNDSAYRMRASVWKYQITCLGFLMLYLPFLLQLVRVSILKTSIGLRPASGENYVQ